MQIFVSTLARPAYITFGFDPTITDPVALATSCAAAYGSVGSLFSIMDGNSTLNQTRVSLGTDGGEDVVGVSGQVVAGTKSGTSIPPNVAVLVHKNTARGGRRGRGRLFIPWACTALDVGENGVIQTTTVTAIQNAVETFRTALASLAGPMVVLHNLGKTVPGAPNQVTSLTVDKLISTQRRRLGR